MAEREKINEERLDRMESHIKSMKEQQKLISDSLLEIKGALVGSAFNGGYGIVERVKHVDNRVEELEKMAQENKVYIKQSKFVIGAFMLAVIGLIVERFKN